MRHALARIEVRLLRAGRFVAGRQILEGRLERLQRQTVCELRRHHRGIRLERVRNRIDARRARQSRRREHHHVRINDRHVRHELVVRERILRARLLVGDDGERRHFGTRARRGRNRDELRLLAHLREGVGALADVHEAHRHIEEVALRVLVENPHDLAGVHGAASADGDDHVRLELGHQTRPVHRARDRRIRRHVGERRHGAPLLFKATLDRLRVAIRVEEVVRHDERALAVPDFADLAQRHRQAALLDIDLFRCTEPQHVFSPDRDCFDVEQMHRTHVGRHRVAAPAAAAERQRRRELEVVQIADTALRRRRVDENAAGFHARLELGELVLVVAFIQIDRGGVAVAAVFHELLRHVDGLVEILRAVHRQHRAELLVRERLGLVHTRDLADHDLRRRRDIHARKLRDCHRLLADNLRVDCSVLVEDNLADLVQFVRLEEVAAAIGELLLHRVVDLVQHDDGLFGGADHAVVERLGVDDRADRELDVRRVVDDRRRVAGADAESRLTRAVGRLHHRRTARRENDVRILHEELGLFDGRLLHARDDVFGRARLDRRVQNDHRRVVRALLRARMRADDDAIARLERDEGLENRRRGRVRGRDDRADDANRLGDLAHAKALVFLDHAARLHVLVAIEDVFGREVVLDDLVLDNAHARLLHGVLGERNALAVRRERRRTEDLVDLFLRVGRELLLRGTHFRQCFSEFLRVRADGCGGSRGRGFRFRGLRLIVRLLHFFLTLFVQDLLRRKI